MQEKFDSYIRRGGSAKDLGREVPFDSLDQMLWFGGKKFMVDGIFVPMPMMYVIRIYRAYSKELLEKGKNSCFTTLETFDTFNHDAREHYASFFLNTARKHGSRFVRLFPRGFFSQIPEMMNIERTYALAILTTDGFFAIDDDTSRAQRFLRIMTVLPIELQQLVANRAFSSVKNAVSSSLFEEAIPLCF